MWLVSRNGAARSPRFDGFCVDQVKMAMTCVKVFECRLIFFAIFVFLLISRSEAELQL